MTDRITSKNRIGKRLAETVNIQVPRLDTDLCVRRAAGSTRVVDMGAKVRQKTLRMLSNGVYVLTSWSEGQFGAATVTGYRRYPASRP